MNLRVYEQADMFKEHDTVVLTGDILNEQLKSGDVGTIIHIYNQGAAFEVEFLTLAGDTVAIATVFPSQVRPVSGQDITHARRR